MYGSFTGHTFGTPSHGCPEGRLGESSAIVRCSGSGMHAGMIVNESLVSRVP